MTGHWWSFAHSPDVAEASGGIGYGADDSTGVGIVIVAMRPSIDFTPVFDHGFVPTVHRATVTANVDADDDLPRQRIIKSLARMGRLETIPAAELYNKWTAGYFDEELEQARATGQRVNILTRSTAFPLGTAGANRARRSDVDLFGVDGDDGFSCTPIVTAHPAFIYPDGSLAIFVAAPVGTELQLLCGTAGRIVDRIEVFGDALDERAPFSRDSVLGSLVMFCGGAIDFVMDEESVAPHESGTVHQAFTNAALQKPFVAIHPFGEQCFKSGWDRPVHANLMFGGVVFGKAQFGMSRRSELFLSYQWGEQQAKTDGQRPVYTTQQFVSRLKVDLEHETRLTCWFDLNRMGAGVDIDNAMREGVKMADIFICCITDRYLRSVNCLKEFSFAVEKGKLIVPLLLPGYGDADDKGEPTSTPWPPSDTKGMMSKALATSLYVDLRTPELRKTSFPNLVNRLDSEVRKLRMDQRTRKTSMKSPNGFASQKLNASRVRASLSVSSLLGQQGPSKQSQGPEVSDATPKPSRI
mmetsp:Transcript_43261/g.127228  ORF Transcript_43261/g.127228 Transcript_43261/m.127228 type:complete len:525 (+) Transcript_43261:631-2205(+)